MESEMNLASILSLCCSVVGARYCWSWSSTLFRGNETTAVFKYNISNLVTGFRTFHKNLIGSFTYKDSSLHHYWNSIFVVSAIPRFAEATWWYQTSHFGAPAPFYSVTFCHPINAWHLPIRTSLFVFLTFYNLEDYIFRSVLQLHVVLISGLLGYYRRLLSWQAWWYGGPGSLFSGLFLFTPRCQIFLK